MDDGKEDGILVFGNCCMGNFVGVRDGSIVESGYGASVGKVLGEREGDSVGCPTSDLEVGAELSCGEGASVLGAVRSLSLVGPCDGSKISFGVGSMDAFTVGAREEGDPDFPESLLVEGVEDIAEA